MYVTACAGLNIFVRRIIRWLVRPTKFLVAQTEEDEWITSVCRRTTSVTVPTVPGTHLLARPILRRGNSIDRP